MTVIIKFIKLIINIIFSFFKLFKVKDKVTIASRQSNEEYLDLKMLREEIERISPQTEVVVLCKKIEGSPVHKLMYGFHLIRQMYHIATSKAVVVDSYCIGVSIPKQRPELMVIQIWHALGAFKKFGLSIVTEGEGEGRSAKVAELMNMHKNYTYVLMSGSACREPYKEAFGYGDESMIIGSLPRVDLILSNEFKEKTLAKIREKYPHIGTDGRKVIVYAPTFRKNEDISEYIRSLARAFDPEKYIFVAKLHPLMEFSGDTEGILLDRDFSTLEMLYASDYVIGDYSAIVFEAALLDRPLFFYAFDIDTYEGARDFYLDYRVDMPGIIAKEPQKIAEAVENGDYDLERIRNFADRYVEYKEDCTNRLAKIVLGIQDISH